MVSVTMATSEWIQFFKEAGIPPGPAVNYAVTFVDNRIQKNMLLDLTKELMNELGITVVGDIIAILKHAKIVYRQEMCKAATESLYPGSPPLQAEPRRNAAGAASRMIANSLSRDSPPAAPPLLRQRPPASKISVTVSNNPGAAKAGFCGGAEENPAIPGKRRRVTAEMEGKYIIHMPKGTTPRTKKILEQQAAKGLQRTSVFDRLGAEAKADAAAGGKPRGVFSRLGDALGPEGDEAPESDDDDDDSSSVLQYAGVLKKLVKPFRKENAESEGKAEKKIVGSEAKKPLVGARNVAGIRKPPPPSPPASQTVSGEAQDSVVTSSKDKTEREFRVTIKRTWGCGKVSSTSESPGAQMDSAGTVSVFKRLGKKPD
ncbi:uncharacterized protein C19orf47 homolog [Larus michahellis]|uniref:uncharacterized protein C19orf47 homolog n=1 Tax=Larus michahellis TaxID=119627 RepID=UPI003D9B533C